MPLLRSLKGREEGLSSILVAIILIGVALAGGFVAYKAFRGYMQTTTANVSIRVEDVTAMSVPGGQNYASATVKNTGTTRVENVVVTIINSGGSDVILEIGTLDPGETGSDKATHDLAAGVSYPVQVSATVPGNSPEKQQVVLTLKVRVS